MKRRLLGIVVALSCLAPAAAMAERSANPMHPPFAVFDASGLPVLASPLKLPAPSSSWETTVAWAQPRSSATMAGTWALSSSMA